MYEILNTHAEQAPSIIARRAFKAAVHDIRTPHPTMAEMLANYFNPVKPGRDEPSFQDFLDKQAAQSFEHQYETVRGVAHAWEDTLPEQMMSIASQMSTLTSRQWFGFSHVTPLVSVTEKFGFFARAHGNEDALSLARSALSRSMQFDLLKYVLNRGADKVAEKPQVEAPSVLRLAAA